jgi:NADPH-dependent curcumin reductase CurA
MKLTSILDSRRLMRGSEVRLVRRPTGIPVPDDFALAETAVDPVPPTGHVLVRNQLLSVDPYMRGRMDNADSYVAPFALGEAMDGAAIGVVVASADPRVAPGDVVAHDLGWREVAVVPAAAVRPVDVGQAPAEAYLGALGMTGLTAYVGLTRIAPITAGDVVYVSAAAGAVGLVAGTVARALGAGRVIGSAGSADKCRRLVTELGYDAAVNHRDGDLAAQLAQVAPDGIDVYFDNVGGAHLEAALATMRPEGRVALCGAIGEYNAAEPVPGPANLILAIKRCITLRGFLVGQHLDLYPEFLTLAHGWRRQGLLPDAQTVFSGIDNAVDAFLALMSGENTGKVLVRL